MLNINGKIENDVAVVDVCGRVDSVSAGQFEKAVEEMDTVSGIALDFKDLEYISSAGLRVILKLRKKHADLEIRNASAEVYEILEMTGFTDMVNVLRA